MTWYWIHSANQYRKNCANGILSFEHNENDKFSWFSSFINSFTFSAIESKILSVFRAFKHTYSSHHTFKVLSIYLRNFHFTSSIFRISVIEYDWSLSIWPEEAKFLESKLCNCDIHHVHVYASAARSNVCMRVYDALYTSLIRSLVRSLVRITTTEATAVAVVWGKWKNTLRDKDAWTIDYIYSHCCCSSIHTQYT